MRIRCPICKEMTTWEENPNRPFCSEKCRMKDLGAWAAEQYRIEGRKEDDNETPSETETDSE